jgi:Tol biopolymer transport system component
VGSLRSDGQRASETERNRKTDRKRRSAVGGFGALMAVSALVALLGAAPASADENGCPTSNSIGNRLPSNLVGASFTTSANTATYKFDSLVDREVDAPADGVPGLIAYCIYPGSQPDGGVTTSATGADGSAWQDPPAFDNFSFERSDGNPSNIPLDGTTGITMGTATWTGGVPQNQIIVLHINDAEECAALYGGTPGTCFVRPAGAVQTPNVTTAPHFQDHSPVPIDGAYPNFKATVGAIVHDSATVGDTTNGTPTGSVEFRKFDNGDCSGEPADTETVALSGGAADQTTNYGPINQQTTLSFQAIYTSNDTSKWTNASSACEKLTVVCQVTFASKRTGTGDIYLMEGSAQTRLTTNPALDRQPAFFSAAGKIAFASNRAGNSEIYSMNVSGTAVTRLTADPAIDAEPSWSPDGTTIAFASNRTGDGDIYVMNADGTDQRRLTTDAAADSSPAWSPDGNKLAFASKRTGDGDVYVMNADGTDQTRVTTNAAVDSSPDWSPDGTNVAFASKRTGNGDVYVVNADGTAQMRLTTNAAVDGEPSFSQHARTAGKIDFVSNRDGDSEIYAMNASGARWRLTTNVVADSSPDAP